MRNPSLSLFALALVGCGAAVAPRPVAPTVVAAAPPPPPAPRYVSLASTDAFVCGLETDASVWCSGDNLRGGLAQGRGLTRSVAPIEVAAARGAVQLVANGGRACVRMQDGRVLCWGAPYNREAVDPGWQPGAVREVPALRDVTQLAAGSGTVCGVTSGRQLRCVGLPQPTRRVPFPTETDVVRVAVAGWVVCIERANGAVSCQDPTEDADAWSLRAPGASLRELLGSSVGIVAWQADGALLHWALRIDSASRQSPPTALGVFEGVNASTTGLCAWRAGVARCASFEEEGIDGSGVAWAVGDVHLGEVPGLTGVHGAVSGQGFTCVLTDGAPRCWGERNEVPFTEGAGGRLLPEGVSPVRGATSLAALNAWCLLDAAGLPWCWGSLTGDAAAGPVDALSLWAPQPRESLPDSVEIALANNLLCARTRDGRARCIHSFTAPDAAPRSEGVGPDATEAAVLGAAPIRTQRVIELATERPVRSLAARSDGPVCVVTDDGVTRCGDVVPPPDATTWRLTPVAGVPEATSVAAYGAAMCVFTASAGVWCWGDNRSWGLLENSEAAVVSRPVARAGLSQAVALGVGLEHACAADRDGALLCWGRAREGQLAIPPRSPLGAPTRVPGVPPVTAVAAGTRHTCVLDRDGRVLCFGDNGHGQLGDGTTRSRATPAAVAGIPRARAIRASGDTTCALTEDGGVWCWGEARAGALGAGRTRDVSTPTPVLMPTRPSRANNGR